MRNIFLPILILSLLFIACDKEEDDKDKDTTTTEEKETTPTEDPKYTGNLMGVLKNSDGLLIENGTVSLYFADNDTLLVKQAVTDASGAFSFTQILEGSYNIAAYINFEERADTFVYDVLPFIDNQATLLYDDFDIISGNVINQHGDTVVGLEVTLEHLKDLKEGFMLTTETDENGDFFFYDIPEGISEIAFTDALGVETTKRFKYERGVILPPPFEFEVLEEGEEEGYYFMDTRDGHIYRYVTIGGQTWMAENLAYLPQVDNDDDGSEDNAAGKYYYVYNFIPDELNDESTQVENAMLTREYQDYGVLYNWNAAMNDEGSSNNTPSGVQGVCPDGWHLPSYNEWYQLRNYIQNVEGLYAGKALRTTGSYLQGTGLWYSDSYEGSDYYEFSANPGGYRRYNNYFTGEYYYSYLWTTVENGANNAYYMRLYYNSNSFDGAYSWDKDNGYSVRCIKDED